MTKEKNYNLETVKFPIYPTQKQVDLLYLMNDLHANLFEMAINEARYRLSKENKTLLIKEAEDRLLVKILFFKPTLISKRDEIASLCKEGVKTCIKKGGPLETDYGLDKKQISELRSICRKPKADFQALCDWATSIRNSLPEYGQLNAWSMQTTLDRVVGSLESFFGNKKSGDKTAQISKGRSPENNFYAIGWKDCLIKDHMIEVKHKIPNHPKLDFEIPNYVFGKVKGKNIRRIEISREYREKHIDCRFTMQLTYEIEKPETKEINRILAIDLGAGSCGGIDSRGRTFKQSMRRSDKFWNKKLAPLKKKRKDLDKNSLEYKKLQEEIRKSERRQMRQMLDFQKKLALRIVKSADCIIVGKTSIRLGLAKSKDGSKKEHRGVQNTGTISRLEILIKNKAQAFGKSVIIVPDADFAEPQNEVDRKILMAVENFKEGLKLLDRENWTPERKEKVLRIISKTISNKPKKFT